MVGRCWVIFCLAGLIQTAYAARKVPSYISVSASAPDLIFDVENEGTESSIKGDRTIRYGPRVPLILGVGYSTGGLSLSYSSTVGPASKELKFRDYTTSYFSEAWGVSGGYTDFKRFHVLKTSGFSAELEPEHSERLGMQVSYTRVNLFWLPLRWGFGLEQAFDPAEEKSTGIGMGGILSYNRLTMNSGRGIIPQPYQQDFGNDALLDDADLTSRNLQACIGFTLAVGGAYLSGLVAAGPGQQQFAYQVGEERKSGRGAATKLRVQALTGYAGKRFFAAAGGQLESPQYILKHMTLGAGSEEWLLISGIKW